MKALLKDGPTVRLAEIPSPELEAGEVLVRVGVAGVCRSDVDVAKGRLASEDPIVLGHEMAGTVEAIASDGARLLVGDRVTVRPWSACGRCTICSDEPIRCARRQMLGVHRNGCFAELIAVPAEAVFRLPPMVSMRAGAYAHSVATALANGSFADAIQLLATGAVDVDDLLGSEHPLEDFDLLFSDAASVTKKPFFRIAANHG